MRIGEEGKSHKAVGCLQGWAGMMRGRAVDSKISSQPALPLPQAVVLPKLLCCPSQKGLGDQELCAVLIITPSQGVEEDCSHGGS